MKVNIEQLKARNPGKEDVCEQFAGRDDVTMEALAAAGLNFIQVSFQHTAWDDEQPSELDDPLYHAISAAVDVQEREGTLCFCPNCRSCNNYEDAKWDYIGALYDAVKARLYGPRVQAA